VYDPNSGFLYATLENLPGGYSNSVVTIDPANGIVGPPLLIGPQLTKLAVTDDGSRLYVLVEQGYRFFRLDLATGQVELQAPVSAPGEAPKWSEWIRAVPGQPESVALVVQDPGVLGGDPMIRVYDGSVPRPAAVRAPAFEFY